MRRVQTVLHVAGARPNFMKIAPVLEALRERKGLRQILVHTGQHHDREMSGTFFEELDLPRPDHDLGAGGGTHAQQTAAIMIGIERVLAEERPDLVVVVGDVNSTLAAAIVAAKAGIPVAHVEAGLRSHDWSMPEEINRLVTDRLSTILLTPSRDADENLSREGIQPERVHFVGNVMIDTLLRHRPRAPWPLVQKALDLEHRGFAVLTLHRPANVDSPETLGRILERVRIVASRYPIVFPVHPRTALRLREHGLEAATFLRIVDPLGYAEFLALMDHAALVLTDSGGIQEETTILGVPCFTLRDNTERPITVSEGTNTLVGADARDLLAAFRSLSDTAPRPRRIPEGWDGMAGKRVGRVLGAFLDESRA